ncbi:MAG: hypothetical protein ACTH7W_09665 [Psychrobacter sp.]
MPNIRRAVSSSLLAQVYHETGYYKRKKAQFTLSKSHQAAIF